MGQVLSREELRAVSDHLKTTLAVLKKTENEAAVPVLIAALDSRWKSIRQEALQALLSRRNPAGHREILGRLQTLDEPSLSAIRECGGRLTHALRDAVLSTDESMCRNGCQVALWLDEYDLIPAILSALGDPSNPNSACLGATLLELVEALDAEIAAPRPDRHRDPQMVRASVLTSLETSVGRFPRHRRREPVEAFLVLADRDQPLFRQILEDPFHAAFVTVIDLLSKSRRTGVIRLLLSCVDDPDARSAVLSVIGNRHDLAFVRLLARKIGRAPSPMMLRNLRRIETIGWLRNAPPVLVELDGEGQAAAVQFVVRSAASRRQALAMIEHLLAYGKPEGRRAAAVALAEFDGAEANALAVRALADDDPIVQAAVIPRLRGRGIPGVLARLIELVDSPHDVVRRAIRESLDEFGFDRFTSGFDLLDDEMRRRRGLLVKQIDSTTLPRLREELVSGLRTRRLRALQMLRAMEATGEMERDVIAVLRRDPDHLVRMEAIATLAESGSVAAQRALRRALRDQSTAVREAARRALEELAQTPDATAQNSARSGP